jgi:hypothetical protein
MEMDCSNRVSRVRIVYITKAILAGKSSYFMRVRETDFLYWSFSNSVRSLTLLLFILRLLVLISFWFSFFQMECWNQSYS